MKGVELREFGRDTGEREFGTEGGKLSFKSLHLPPVRISAAQPHPGHRLFSHSHTCVIAHVSIDTIVLALFSCPPVKLPFPLRLSHQLEKNPVLLHRQGEISLLSTRPRSNMKIIHVPTIVTDPLQSPSQRLTYSEVTDENSR
jgi:hypothetical protein